jgi:hypothetical protein
MKARYNKMKTYEIRVCKDCLEEIKVIKAGDESWDYCEGCHQFEGDTVYIDENGEVVPC